MNAVLEQINCLQEFKWTYFLAAWIMLILKLSATMYELEDYSVVYKFFTILFKKFIVIYLVGFYFVAVNLDVFCIPWCYAYLK